MRLLDSTLYVHAMHVTMELVSQAASNVTVVVFG